MSPYTAPTSRVVLRLVMTLLPSHLCQRNEEQLCNICFTFGAYAEKTCLNNLRRKTMVVISCCSRTSFQHVYIFKQVLTYPLLLFLCLTFRESEDSLSEPCTQVMMPNSTINNLSTKSPIISAESHYSRIHIKTTKNV